MTDGIVGRKGAFSREFVQLMREDIDAAFDEARPGGAVGRGPHRWYVEIHPRPARLRGPRRPPVGAPVCEAVLGPDYRIVEIGFDVPFAGRGQPAVAPRLPDAGDDP